MLNTQLQNKIHHIVYLYLLNKNIKLNSQQFVDSLVHIYRLIRLEAEWKIDKPFVSINYSVIDSDQTNILKSLMFFEMLDNKGELTQLGEDYLQNELQENDKISTIFVKFEEEYSTKIAYEDTCLSSTTPTSANCGICKKMICIKKTNLTDVFNQYLRLPNYKRSYSQK